MTVSPPSLWKCSIIVPVPPEDGAPSRTTHSVVSLPGLLLGSTSTEEHTLETSLVTLTPLGTSSVPPPIYTLHGSIGCVSMDKGSEKVAYYLRRLLGLLAPKDTPPTPGYALFSVHSKQQAIDPFQRTTNPVGDWGAVNDAGDAGLAKFILIYAACPLPGTQGAARILYTGYRSPSEYPAGLYQPLLASTPVKDGPCHVHRPEILLSGDTSDQVTPSLPLIPRGEAGSRRVQEDIARAFNMIYAARHSAASEIPLSPRRPDRSSTLPFPSRDRLLTTPSRRRHQISDISSGTDGAVANPTNPSDMTRLASRVGKLDFQEDGVGGGGGRATHSAHLARRSSSISSVASSISSVSSVLSVSSTSSSSRPSAAVDPRTRISRSVPSRAARPGQGSERQLRPTPSASSIPNRGAAAEDKIEEYNVMRIRKYAAKLLEDRCGLPPSDPDHELQVSGMLLSTISALESQIRYYKVERESIASHLASLLPAVQLSLKYSTSRSATPTPQASQSHLGDVN